MSNMADASRQFLVQRFVEDAQRRYSMQGMKMSFQSSDTDERSSDSGHSDPDGSAAAVQASERAGFPNVHMLNGTLQLAAATLASLGPMHFLQPAAAAAACTLPLLYPHLYQSLLTFPNLDLLRQKVQSSNVEERSKQSVQPKQPTTPKATRKRTGSGDTSMSKKHKLSIKRVPLDEETSSPVSGMYIRDAKDVPPEEMARSQQQKEEEADDESALWVETSEEARAELALIPNLIGDYICCLCKVRYEDAFRLARHKCPRIAHEEYRCPECSKVFSCPANLASHRRWHRPRYKPEAVAETVQRQEYEGDEGDDDNEEADEEQCTNDGMMTAFESIYACELCDRRFESHRLLRAHAIRHTNFAPQQFNNDDQELQCDQPNCHLWFPGKDRLKEHKNGAHPLINCALCGKRMASGPLLVRHIAKHHSAELTARCKD
uniref:C2H2-type domain-containing protein n=1 Tax=Trichuris muris TaxID=70415 RepID=A0A5S6QYY8_TRIMR